MDITSYIMGSIAGAKSASGLKYLVVDELPTTGDNNTIYLVPKSTSETNNYYDEYMYINNAWELIGDTQVDLTNYVQKTDYATSETGGVVKVGNGNSITSGGILYPNIYTFANYQNLSGNTYIGKGTLENVIDGKGLITQYSTMPTASSSNEGKIVQYTGTTDNTYTNGYFYQCVSDGQDPATYSWENVNVQDGGGSTSNDIFIDGTGNIDTQANREALAPLINNPDTFRGNIYLKINYSGTIYYLLAKSYRTYGSYIYLEFSGYNGSTTGYYVYNKILRLITIGFNTTTKEITSISSDSSNYQEQTLVGPYGYNTGAHSLIGVQPWTYAQTYEIGDIVSHEGTIFKAIERSSYENWKWSRWESIQYVPYLAKIVNEAITGYDATKTQVLKNINGTLTWQDENISTYQLAGLSEYSSSSTYAVGDYVYYNNLIYKCNTAVSVAEAFDSNKWTQKTYMEYMSDTLVGTALGGSY